MSYFRNLIYNIGYLTSIPLKLKVQKQLLNNILVPFSTNLSKHINLRLKTYGLYVPVFIGESYSLLRGFKMTEVERQSITYLGCMTGIFDDLFDDHTISDSAILQLIDSQVLSDNHTEIETTLLQLYEKFTVSSNQRDIDTLIHKIFQAQVDSKLQFNASISNERIKEITFNKGGYSMQLYRRAFSGEIDANEDALFFNIGAIGQLENDLFDIYKDFSEGIHTLVTRATKIDDLRKIYTQLQKDVLMQIDNLNYSNNAKKQFKLIFAFITARGEVALDKLEKSECNTQNGFDIGSCSRSQLICDMEKPFNWLKLLHYASKCSKK